MPPHLMLKQWLLHCKQDFYISITGIPIWIEKQYTCHKCEARFSHIGTLKYHMQTHAGKKPYTCCNFEKGFSQKKSSENTQVYYYCGEAIQKPKVLIHTKNHS